MTAAPLVGAPGYTPRGERSLSEHFSLAELAHSDLAARSGIDNTPPEALVPSLTRTAAGAEQVRAFLSGRAGYEVPLIALSGYRSETLERVLCARDFALWCKRHGKTAPGERMQAEVEASWREYFARKRHPLGLALDFIAPRFGTPYLVAMTIARSAIGFDQLIYEHTWVHIAVPELAKPPRRDVLTLMADGGYAPGIIERSTA